MSEELSMFVHQGFSKQEEIPTTSIKSIFKKKIPNTFLTSANAPCIDNIAKNATYFFKLYHEAFYSFVFNLPKLTLRTWM